MQRNCASCKIPLLLSTLDFKSPQEVWPFMLYTVTLNPCLDYVVSVPDFRSGRVNCANQERIVPGGKGINVSYVLNILKQDTLALGLVGGFTGVEIERLMTEDAIQHDFVHIENGNSRIDVQMINGVESSINGVGPEITQRDIDALCDKLQQLEDGDTLVLSGSVPLAHAIPFIVISFILLPIRIFILLSMPKVHCCSTR